MRIFFTEMLGLMHDIEFDGEPVRLTSNCINGVTHLPLRWSAGARVT